MADRVFTFGKYKGERVLDVIQRDPEYVVWAVRNTGFFQLEGEEFLRLNGALYERQHRQAAQPEEPGDWSLKVDMQEYFEPVPDYGDVTPEELEAYDRSFDQI